MKFLLMVSLVFAAQFAVAETVVLNPGSQLRIGHTDVACAGSNQAPVCDLKSSGSFFVVIRADQTLKVFDAIAPAISAIKEMRDAGLCR